MKILREGALCELLEIDGTLRLYCEGITKQRQESIIESTKGLGQIRSRPKGSSGGALIIDFTDTDLIEFIAQEIMV